MKLLLSLLLLPLICLAQNNFVKVTAYRFVERHNDGACSIVSNINDNDYKDDIAVITSHNPLLPKKLIAFREAVTKGNPLEFHCSNRWISSDIIDAVIILYGKTNDTIFISEKRNLIVIPKQSKAYGYSREEFMKLLNPKMNAFFTQEFGCERRKLINGEK